MRRAKAVLTKPEQTTFGVYSGRDVFAGLDFPVTE